MPDKVKPLKTMPSKNESISIEQVAPILFDELEYSDPLSAKAFHKLVHSIHKNLEESPLDSQIEYFWYKYGTCVRTPTNSGVTVTSTGGGSEVTCSTTPEEIDLDDEDEDILREAANDSLDLYYGEGLEHLTDLQYSIAPYEVQRQYRALDKELQQIRSEHGAENRDYNSEKIHTLVNQVTDSFPTSEFPEHENELYQMHSVVDNALSSNVEIEKIIGVTDTFWSLFCLDLSQVTATNTSQEEVLTEINVGNEKLKKKYLRKKLDKYESTLITVDQSSPELDTAAEALMASRLGYAGGR